MLSKPTKQTDPVVEAREFRRIVTVFTALAMLFIGKVITEGEFVAYLREAVCNVQEK